MSTTTTHNGRSAPSATDYGASIIEFLQREPPKHQWLVEDLVPEHVLSVIAGEPKANKSTFVQELIIAIATGSPAFGRFKVPERRKVVFVQEESTDEELQDRFLKILAGHGLPLSALDDRVRVLSNTGFTFAPKRDPVTGKSIESDGERLIRLGVDTFGADVVVLDSLRDLHPYQENDSTEMMQVLTPIKQLRNHGGHVNVIVIHHMGKPGQNAPRNPAQRLRGSSAIWGEFDSGIFLTPASQGKPKGVRDTEHRRVHFDRRHGQSLAEQDLLIHFEPNQITFEMTPKKQRAEATGEGLSNEMRNVLKALDREGNLTYDEFEARTKIKRKPLQSVCSALVKMRLIAFSGGTKNNPKVFSLTPEGEVRVEAFKATAR